MVFSLEMRMGFRELVCVIKGRIGVLIVLPVRGRFQVIFPERLCDHRFVFVDPGTPNFPAEYPPVGRK